MTFKGTLYELSTKECLESNFNCHGMTRVGGAGDNGVDILGKWNLARSWKGATKAPKSALLLVSKQLHTLKEEAPAPKTKLLDLESDVTVLVQCKNSRSRIKASTIRELAGIYEYHVKTALDRMRVFFFLVSPFPATLQAQGQMDTSNVPIVHLKLLPYILPQPTGSELDYTLENWEGNVPGQVYMNPRARKLLEGLDVRPF